MQAHAQCISVCARVQSLQRAGPWRIDFGVTPFRHRSLRTVLMMHEKLDAIELFHTHVLL